MRGVCRVPVWDGAGRRFVWVKINTPDYGLGLSRRWRLDQHGYPCGHFFDAKRGKSTTVFLHRLVARARRAEQVDHKHHDLLDCRRSQLRRCSPSQNSANTRRFKAHTSRYRGVTRHSTGKWQAQCKHGDTNHYLGLHATEEQAAAAYDRRAVSLFGEFARTNNVPSPVTAQERAA